MGYLQFNEHPCLARDYKFAAKLQKIHLPAKIFIQIKLNKCFNGTLMTQPSLGYAKDERDLEKLGDVEADIEKNRRCAFMGHGVGGTYRECACLES